MQKKALTLIDDVKTDASSYESLVSLERKLLDIRSFEFEEISLELLSLQEKLFCLIDLQVVYVSAQEINKFFQLSKLVHSILPISEKEAKRVKSARILLENDLRKETKSLEASISKITTMLQEVKQVDFVILWEFPSPRIL